MLNLRYLSLRDLFMCTAVKHHDRKHPMLVPAPAGQRTMRTMYDAIPPTKAVILHSFIRLTAAPVALSKRKRNSGSILYWDKS